MILINVIAKNIYKKYYVKNMIVALQKLENSLKLFKEKCWRVIEKKLVVIIRKHFLVWGVGLETNLPPEFLISSHATIRLKQRTPFSPEKYNKVVAKAWVSKIRVSNAFINTKNYHRDQKNVHYKMFCGYVFIFKEVYKHNLGTTQKILITVY